MAQLIDQLGRRIDNLRISVTDRCNFRCLYCMPEEGMEWIPKEEVLSFEEIEKLVGVLAPKAAPDRGRAPLAKRPPRAGLHAESG